MELKLWKAGGRADCSGSDEQGLLHCVEKGHWKWGGFKKKLMFKSGDCKKGTTVQMW